MRLVEQVQAWIDANWSLDITIREWWRRLAAEGFGYPSWPAGVGGRGASSAESATITKVLAGNEVVGPPVGHVAATLAAPIILRHGTKEQRQRFVRAIAAGEESWCQLFSEPGSGSDLASVAASAEWDGDEWVVNGQKTWNSAADKADFGLLIARTDRDRPKHSGMTYFVIDMHQPGVEVRPLRTMNGSSPFCEVFLTDARVGPGQLIGGLHEGWMVAQTTLAAERNSVAGGGTRGLVQALSGRSGDLDATVREVVERARRASKAKSSRIKSNAVPWDVMLSLARDSGRSSDVVARQELVRYYAQVRINGWVMRRIGSHAGMLTGADGSLAKLATSRICQMSRELSYRLIGAAGMLVGPESPLDGELQVANLASPGIRIGGGTDEIQLNVIGERALGLPKEPAVGRDLPFRELRVGTQRP